MNKQIKECPLPKKFPFFSFSFVCIYFIIIIIFISFPWRIFWSYLVSIYDRKVNDGGVVSLNTSNWFKKTKALERVSNSERSKRIVGGQEERPSEPDTVETHWNNPLGDDIQRLFAKPFGQHGFKMWNPIQACQFHSLPTFVHNPPRVCEQRQSCYWLGLGYYDGEDWNDREKWETGQEDDFYHFWNKASLSELYGGLEKNNNSQVILICCSALI